MCEEIFQISLSEFAGNVKMELLVLGTQNNCTNEAVTVNSRTNKEELAAIVQKVFAKEAYKIEAAVGKSLIW